MPLFVSPFSCLATLPPPPSIFRPPTLPSVPNWLDCESVDLNYSYFARDKPISAPAKSRKKRSDRHASDETEDDVDGGTVIKQRESLAKIEQTRKANNEENAATPWNGGQLTLLGRSSHELLRRRLISSFDPMTRKTCLRRENKRLRAALRLYRRA